MKKIIVTILTLCMALGLTGCMAVEETLDLTKKGNYSMTTSAQFNMTKIQLVGGMSMEKAKEYFDSEMAEEDTPYEYVEKEDGNTWIKLNQQEDGMNKRQLKKMFMDGMFSMSKVTSNGVKRFVFNDKKFVLEGYEGDDYMNEIVTSLEELVAQMEELGISSETQLAINPKASKEEKDFVLASNRYKRAAKEYSEAMKAYVNTWEFTSVSTIRFPNKVTKTNGILQEDGQTVVWEDTSLTKFYAFFE